MAIKTRITEKLGIETPIIMGGMTGVGYGPLVAAVANAGALGFITAHMYPTGQALFDEIEATRKLTDKTRTCASWKREGGCCWQAERWSVCFCAAWDACQLPAAPRGAEARPMCSVPGPRLHHHL